MSFRAGIHLSMATLSSDLDMLDSTLALAPDNEQDAGPAPLPTRHMDFDYETDDSKVDENLGVAERRISGARSIADARRWSTASLASAASLADKLDSVTRGEPRRIQIFLPKNPMSCSEDANLRAVEERIEQDLAGDSRNYAFHGETLTVYVVVEPPRGIGMSVVESEKFFKRFSQLELSHSVSATAGQRQTPPSVFESTRLHAWSVTSLGSADILDKKFGASRLVVLPNKSLVFITQVQLAHVSAQANHATVSISCSLVTDPLLKENVAWADEIIQLCDLDSPSYSNLPQESIYFKNEVSMVIELRRPPHVFFSRAQISSALHISIEVQNHLDVDIVVDDIQLYLCPKERGPKRNQAADSEDSAVDTTKSKSRKGKNFPRDGTILQRKGKEALIFEAGTDLSEEIAIRALSVSLPETLPPESRQSFMFALRPPIAIPKGGSQGIDPAVASENQKLTPREIFEAVNAFALITWSTKSLTLPISCYYDLFAIQPKGIELCLSVYQNSTPVVGKEFEVVYTITNTSQQPYRDLFLVISSPTLADLQVPVMGKSLRSSEKSMVKLVNHHDQHKASMLRQALRSCKSLGKGSQIHVQALHAQQSSEVGLVCQQKRVKLGYCGPCSKTSAPVSFIAYKSGFYEIGLVQIVEGEDFVPHHALGYQVYISSRLET